MYRAFGILVTTVAIGGGLQQPATSNSDAERHKDVYAIYSILMSNPPSPIGGGGPTYAIASTTKPAMSQGNPSNPCFYPPVGYESRWKEILADFNARGNTAETLDRDLIAAKPYVFVKPEDVAGYVNPQSNTASQKREVFFLSNVYFNQNRTLALTGIYSWCGPRCALGQWKMYEKVSDRTWKEVVPKYICTEEE